MNGLVLIVAAILLVLSFRHCHEISENSKQRSHDERMIRLQAGLECGRKAEIDQ